MGSLTRVCAYPNIPHMLTPLNCSPEHASRIRGKFLNPLPPPHQWQSKRETWYLVRKIDLFIFKQLIYFLSRTCMLIKDLLGGDSVIKGKNKQFWTNVLPGILNAFTINTFQYVSWICQFDFFALIWKVTIQMIGCRILGFSLVGGWGESLLSRKFWNPPPTPLFSGESKTF